MKFSMFIVENAIQLNLTPESEHEKEFMSLLDRYTGEVSIHRGVSINRSMGGFINMFGTESNTVAILIYKPKPSDGLKTMEVAE